jgi:hypothetical protein
MYYIIIVLTSISTRWINMFSIIGLLMMCYENSCCVINKLCNYVMYDMDKNSVTFIHFFMHLDEK